MLLVASNVMCLLSAAKEGAASKSMISNGVELVKSVVSATNSSEPLITPYSFTSSAVAPYTIAYVPLPFSFKKNSMSSLAIFQAVPKPNSSALIAYE